MPRGWAHRQFLEMVRRAIEREPDITPAQLGLRFGVRPWLASKYLRKYRESKFADKEEDETWE
jgi:hypothetical protein